MQRVIFLFEVTVGQVIDKLRPNQWSCCHEARDVEETSYPGAMRLKGNFGDSFFLAGKHDNMLIRVDDNHRMVFLFVLSIFQLSMNHSVCWSDGADSRKILFSSHFISQLSSESNVTIKLCEQLAERNYSREILLTPARKPWLRLLKNFSGLAEELWLFIISLFFGPPNLFWFHSFKVEVFGAKFWSELRKKSWHGCASFICILLCFSWLVIVIVIVIASLLLSCHSCYAGIHTLSNSSLPKLYTAARSMNVLFRIVIN